MYKHHTSKVFVQFPRHFLFSALLRVFGCHTIFYLFISTNAIFLSHLCYRRCFIHSLFLSVSPSLVLAPSLFRYLRTVFCCLFFFSHLVCVSAVVVGVFFSFYPRVHLNVIIKEQHNANKIIILVVRLCRH